MSRIINTKLRNVNTCINKNNNIELTDVKIYKDEGDSNEEKYFLRLEYKMEDQNGIYKIIFPKISANIPMNYLPNIVEEGISTGEIISYLCFGNSNHSLLLDENGNYMYKILIEPKVHEMTIEEIEKKLGYKIKIVLDKEEK